MPPVGRPEAGGVRGEDLVGEDQVVPVEAELELGVREDDAALAGDVPGAGVDGEGGLAQTGRRVRADLAGDLLVGDVLVVLADLGLGGRGEDRGGQLRAVDQALGEGEAADGAGLVVLRQARAGEVAAGHALHGDHPQRLADQGAALPVGGGAGGQLAAQDVVRGQVGELLEPPQGELGEDPALVGDLGRQHPVVGGDAVAGDHHEVARLVPVQLAHLAGVQMHQARNLERLGLFNESGHGSSPWF